MTAMAGDLGMPGVWWCWLCNTRGCAVPDGPDTTELMFAHLNDAHPRIRPTEEPTLPSPLSAERHEYFERDPDPSGLPAAQIAVEHLRHCDQELLWDGTTHAGGLEDAYNRFVCANPACYFRVTIMVHECDLTEAIIPAAPSIESAGHTPPDEAVPFGTLNNHFCMMCGARVGGPHGVNPPVRPPADAPEPVPVDPDPEPAPDKPPVKAAHRRPRPDPATATLAAVGAERPPVRKAPQ